VGEAISARTSPGTANIPLHVVHRLAQDEVTCDVGGQTMAMIELLQPATPSRLACRPQPASGKYETRLLPTACTARSDLPALLPDFPQTGLSGTAPLLPVSADQGESLLSHNGEKRLFPTNAGNAPRTESRLQ